LNELWKDKKEHEWKKVEKMRCDVVGDEIK
jgi:hypothetical protein